jgi:hypothetical protein
MNTRQSIKRSFALAAMLIASAALGSIAIPVLALAPQKAVAREKSPPGDIPDDQVFVTYKSPQGFSLKVPEGWARKDAADGVSFSDKYGRIEVTVRESSAPATAAGGGVGEAADLEKSGQAVKVSAIKDVRLPSGPAVRIIYTSNSDPNPVTSKQIRLECERYLIPHAGKVVALTFSAPAGADNADQWKLMSDSFRWN